MERQKPTVIDRLQSEQGHSDPFDVMKFMILWGVAYSAITLFFLQREIGDIKDALENTPTPTPTPEVSIDSFENSFNSELQVAFPNN